jgi:hypothetical protein
MVMCPRAVAGLCGWFFRIISAVSGEGRIVVVGKPSFGDGLVEGFGCGGSKSGGSIVEDELFVPDDVRGCCLPGLGEGETPHVCIAVFDAVVRR